MEEQSLYNHVLRTATLLPSAIDTKLLTIINRLLNLIGSSLSIVSCYGLAPGDSLSCSYGEAIPYCNSLLSRPRLTPLQTLFTAGNIVPNGQICSQMVKVVHKRSLQESNAGLIK